MISFLLLFFIWFFMLDTLWRLFRSAFIVGSSVPLSGRCGWFTTPDDSIIQCMFFYDDCINFFRFSHLVLLLGPPPCFMHTVINHDVTRARVFFPLSFFLSFFWPRDWRKYDCGAQFYDECIVSYHIRGSSAATSRFPRSLSKLRSSKVYNNEDHEQRGNKKQLIIKLLHWHILL